MGPPGSRQAPAIYVAPTFKSDAARGLPFGKPLGVRYWRCPALVEAVV